MKTSRFINLLFITILVIISGCSGNKESSPVLLLREGWQIRPSEGLNKPGEEISTAFTDEPGWYKATVPSTVFGCLVNDGVYKDVFIGKNLENVDRKQFQKTIGAPFFRRSAFPPLSILHVPLE